MGQAVKFDYFYGEQADQYSFYRIPKVLFTNECFQSLSCEAKVLYGLMLDRIGLSIKNRWIDDENRVYIIYTIEEIMKHMNCGNKKAVNLVAELDSKKGIGLIEKKRMGLGKANIIYVKNFILIGERAGGKKKEVPDSKQAAEPGHFKKCQNDTSVNVPLTHQEMSGENLQKCQNDTSASVPQTSQEMFREHGINTDSNYTDYSDTDINQSIGEKEEEIDEVAIYREIVKENIEYECLIQNHRQEEIDELVDLMVEVICATGTKIKIAGSEYPIQLVKSKFLKVGYEHIGYVIECLSKNTNKIHNIKAYLLTMLFNAPSTINSYYSAEVRHDMYGGAM